MAWITLHQAVWTHRKTYMLADALALDETYAAAHVIRLWTWALDNAPDGSLRDVSDRALARAAGWGGDVAVFVSALVVAGWLDHGPDGGYAIHDWEAYAGRLIERRRTDAERLRRWREANKDDTQPAIADETSTKRVSYGVTVPNPTGPDPTGPELTSPLPPKGGSANGETIPKPSRVREVAALLTESRVDFTISERDGKAIKASSASPRLIADAFAAAFRGEWDPGGTGWLQGSLSIYAVLNQLSGYQAWRNSKEGRGPRNGHQRPARFANDHL